MNQTSKEWVVVILLVISFVLVAATFLAAVYWRGWELLDWVIIVGFYLARAARNAGLTASEEMRAEL